MCFVLLRIDIHIKINRPMLSNSPQRYQSFGNLYVHHFPKYAIILFRLCLNKEKSNYRVHDFTNYFLVNTVFSGSFDHLNTKSRSSNYFLN